METSFKELWEDFKGQIADRVSNPFTGAFAIAWIVWNFRLLVVLLWIEPYKDKFEYIDKTLYPDIWHWLARGVACPLGTAFAYLVGYAWLTTRAATFYRKRQSAANNEMRAAQGEALMTREDHLKALTKIAKEKQRLKEERDEIGDAGEVQEALVKSLSLELQEAKQTLNSAHDESAAALAAERAESEKRFTALGAAQAEKNTLTNRMEALAQRQEVLERARAEAEERLRVVQVEFEALKSVRPAGFPLPNDTGISASESRLNSMREDPEKVRILVTLMLRSSAVETQSLADEIDAPFNVALHHLEKLSEAGLVDSFDDDSQWSISRAGRSFVVGNKLMDA